MNKPMASPCGARATLLVMLNPAGTSTHVAKERLLLICRLPAGHPGSHVDADQAEQWDAPADANPTLLRQDGD